MNALPTLPALILSLCLAAPALADFPEAVENQILPGYAAFADKTSALADAAAETCAPEVLRPAFQAAFDAWIGVQHLQFGPVERDGMYLAIEYWPDKKASGAKAQLALLTGDPASLKPEAFAQQSVAARGLAGLERLLYPAGPLPADPCPLIRATASDLAQMAYRVHRAWELSYAETVLDAGFPGNSDFLSRAEVRQLLFTQIMAAIEFLHDQRLGRPLGTVDQPHPERAESVASGRSLRNIRLSLAALRGLVESLTPDTPVTMAAFDRAQQVADDLDDPVFAGVATPTGWQNADRLQQAISALQDAVETELGPELDVTIGFNAADGD